MSQIVRDVQGVPGLDVIYGAFNEEYEKTFFRDQNIFPGTDYDWEVKEMEWGKKARTGPGPVSLFSWPQGIDIHLSF